MHNFKDTCFQHKLDAGSSNSDGSAGQESGNPPWGRVSPSKNTGRATALRFCVPTAVRLTQTRVLPRAPKRGPLRPMRSPLLTLLALSVLSVAMQAGGRRIGDSLSHKREETPRRAREIRGA